MSGDIPLPLISPRERRDYYTEFVEGSRWLRREQASARTTWFEELSLSNKQEILFEFEMMLKGLVCFGNPVNHIGPPRRAEPAVAREFRDELGVARSIVRRIVETGRKLAAGGERSVVFQRYLESVIAQDETRFQMVKQSLAQDTPDQSLNLLVSACQNLLEVLDGLSRASHVSFRLFSAIIQMAQREIHRSTYFNPLAALEFRTEFDRIYPLDMLAVVRGIESDPARKVAALTFLALFRLISYLDAIESALKQKAGHPILFGWLAVLRSDIRALTIFLKRDTASWIATGFGNLYEKLEPNGINQEFEGFKIEFHSLKSIRELLASVGDQLRLEQRRLFEQQLPSLGSIESMEQFAESVGAAVGPLRAFIQNALVLLALEFEPSLEGSRLFDNFVPKKEQSERLRRDIWMFQQILRAFIEKATSSASAADKWSGINTFHFVREFVNYFRSMGYPLLRYTDYEQFDKFMRLVDRLREGDVLEVQRVENVVDSCKDFQKFLGNTFNSVGQREELKGIPFDRKEAARTLKLFVKR
ncbi:MAG: hypothetical protein GY854_29445 [Deltaproteobacteria bacterium]|nr:hypothetical protein [Deltaproteobacteria bacterium]